MKTFGDVVNYAIPFQSMEISSRHKWIFSVALVILKKKKFYLIFEFWWEFFLRIGDAKIFASREADLISICQVVDLSLKHYPIYLYNSHSPYEKEAFKLIRARERICVHIHVYVWRSILYGMNVGDRVTRIRCVPVKRCSASSPRAREEEETPPGAAWRGASRRRSSTPRSKSRSELESRSCRSRDSLRRCLMRFGIRKKSQSSAVLANTPAEFPQVRGSIFNPHPRSNSLDSALMIVS